MYLPSNVMQTLLTSEIYGVVSPELLTDMVEGNAPIRALNERLGYRPLPPAIIVSGSSGGEQLGSPPDPEERRVCR